MAGDMKTSQTIESITDIAELEQMVRFLFLTLRQDEVVFRRFQGEGVEFFF